ncbi:hypothetical protein EXIGLDRAFT_732427 [Exidia glandulosa HHB12029]|uniref:B30.2/SPRY domain-containing protein n=1 Tax=Exidia glandulosa HHB12029 TaxID=1314781 RepID=A0A165BJE9_EXIGL|nr:hypothetical protein EXIGLDRAFT_732426 [Exidia glandulosa HHB12029]KZV80761.1 hypothetical protein EXIGLDRAFT_732427 [Exidia glandulosa HHB12029]
MSFKGWGHKLFAPPPGPPPTQATQQQQTFAPPAGPPPSYTPPSAPPAQTRYAPPPGPPPPPSYDDLAAIYPADAAEPPPPPPVLSYFASPALNASADDADAGQTFVEQNPLSAPRPLLPHEIAASDSGDYYLLAPSHFNGYGTATRSPADGSTLVRSARACRDTTLLSHLPLYSASRRTVDTVYYELQIVSLGREGSVAIGFAAVPYPPFRLPGWHRGSIAVHADDGHRFACDADGGVPLTEPFCAGDVVGLGLELRTGQVWFTRNGALAGGWNLREGRTEYSDSWGNEWDGLDGRYDVYAAVGICGEASTIVNLGGARAGRPWMWVPNAVA